MLGKNLENTQLTEETDGEKHPIEDIDEPNFNTFFIYKNLFAVSFSFCLLFTAYNALQNLQSSIHKDPNNGFISLCVVYVSFTLTSLLLPPFILGKFGYKYSMLIGMSGYIGFIVVHYYPELWFMVIGSIAVGSSAGILWAAKSSYVNTLAMKYAETLKQDSAPIISKFMCIFFAFLNGSQIFGNLLSSTILETNSANNTNFSTSIKCGSQLCPSELTIPITGQAKESTIYILISVYFGCGVLGFLCLILLLSPLKRYGQKKSEGMSKWKPFTLTLKLVGNRKAQLILPLTMYLGMAEGFIFADFTKAFVTCPIGIDKVGYIMMGFGIASGTFSMLMTFIIKWVSSHMMLLIGVFLNLCILTWCIFFKVDEMPHYLINITSAVWGMTHIVVSTQTFAMYGIHFPNNQAEAFGLLNVFKNIGYAICFSYGNVFCITTKLYILIVVLVIGGVCYYILARITAKNSNNLIVTSDIDMDVMDSLKRNVEEMEDEDIK